jgi:hypothetical protein
MRVSRSTPDGERILRLARNTLHHLVIRASSGRGARAARLATCNGNSDSSQTRRRSLPLAFLAAFARQCG